MNDINNHGGVRPGAGRKRSELTTLIRVPNSSVLEIKAFLKKAKADPEIDHIRECRHRWRASPIDEYADHQCRPTSLHEAVP